LFFFILHPSSFILCFVGVCWGAAPGAKVVLSPSQARLLEMQVQLAWLNDPLAQPCEVQAKWMGAALEVHGRAPSGGSKQRALELAQQLSPVPILDGVRIVPGQGALRRPAGGSFEDVAARLAQSRAGKAVQELAVWPEADGRMVVSGSVGSVEEKLAVSTSLRELGLGGRIWNRLVVRPAVRGGQLVTPVSADGRLMVVGRPALDTSGDPRGVGFLPAPSDGTDGAMPGAEIRLTTRRRPRRKTVEFASARTEEESSSGGVGVVSAMAKEQDGPDLVSTGARRQDLPAAPEPLPSGLGEPRAEAAPKEPMLPTAAPSAPVGSEARIPAVWQTRPVRVWPPAHDVRPRTTEASPAPKAAAAARPAPPSPLPEPELEPAEEAEPTPPAMPPAISSRGSPEAQQLKQSIDRLCGRFAHYVEIIEYPEGMVVRIQVPSDALAQILLSRLLSIPQIGTQKVHLETIIKP
jgi:hypothetical protein